MSAISFYTPKNKRAGGTRTLVIEIIFLCFFGVLLFSGLHIMAENNQSSEPVTSGQNGIIGPVRVRIISNLDEGSLSVLGESIVNGAIPSGAQQVSMEDFESVSANSSYSESDKSSMDEDIARLVDDMEVKVNDANQGVQNVRNEIETNHNDVM